MNKKIAKYLETNWDELKGTIKKKWAKLTDDDLLYIEGSYNKLYGKLEDLYADKIDDVDDAISTLISKYILKKANFNDQEEGYSMKDMLAKLDEYIDNLKDKVDNIKGKTFDMEKNVEHCVKKNPIKSIGIAVLSGIIFSKLFL